MVAKMTREIAVHELAHVAGLAVSLALLPKYVSASVTVRIDDEGRGETASGVPLDEKEGGTITEEMRARWLVGGAVGPLSLMADAKLYQVFKSARWLDVFQYGNLSDHDKAVAMKAVKVLERPTVDELAGGFGWRSLSELFPQRAEKLVDIVMRHNGLPFMKLRDLIPRKQAVEMRANAVAKAAQLLALTKD